MKNPYLPYPVRIDEIVTETEDKNLKTFKFVFTDPKDEEKFSYIPGQFAELSIAGKGEIPIGIASSPTEKGFVRFTVNKVGLVTKHLHNMSAGEVMGIRGPLGNWYPWDEMEGRNVVIVGGGFAFTTLRSSIVYMLDPDNRSRFKDITVVYGARNPGMLLYKDELAEWEKRDDIAMHITATKPLALNKDQIDPEIINREKAIFAEQVKNKPENIIDKIVQGKLQKFFAENCLLQQAFVKDDSKTIEQVLAEAAKQSGGQATITKFVRFDVG